MKKVVVMMLISGFVSLSAQAKVGQSEPKAIDCKTVLDAIRQQQLKAKNAAGNAVPSSDASEPGANAVPAN